MLIKRNKLYQVRLFICCAAVMTSFIIDKIHVAPPCIYCLMSRYTLLALASYYVLSNIPIEKYLPDFFKRNEFYIEAALILFCFIAGTLAIMAKYGILVGWANLCGQAGGFGCQMSYPFLGFIDLKILSFLGGLSLVLLRLAESIPPK